MSDYDKLSAEELADKVELFKQELARMAQASKDAYDEYVEAQMRLQYKMLDYSEAHNAWQIAVRKQSEQIS